jgi:ABC-type nitrate/sulfonate/bicarbonate transport system permease component
VSAARRRPSRLPDRLAQTGFLLLLLLAWWAITAAGLVTPLFLPGPAAVGTALLAELPSAEFWDNAGTTLFSAASAYLIAVAAGFAAGLLIGRNRFARDVFEPLLAGVFAVPLVIFFPLILLVAGIGPASKIIFAAIYGFFPVALNTIAGFAQVESRYVTFATTAGASRCQTFRRLLLPAALPQIVAGLRIAFVITFASVIAGEMIASISGLGHDIRDASDMMEPARMFAVIVVIVIATGAVNAVLSRLAERP